MEVVLRHVGYTLDEINTMSEKLIFYRFLIAQKVLSGGGEGEAAAMPPIPQSPPLPSSSARGMRRSSSGTSYNFPR